jgi:hypothetical protein
VWAWSPITISEYGNNAHVDWLAALLAVLALTCEAARRSGLAGLLVGAAVATKLYPALLLPAMLRRRPLLVIGSALGLVALSYVPHVLAVGKQVVGYLPGYLQEEQYTSGNRLLLVGAVLPHPLDLAVGVLVLGAVAWWAWRRADPDSPETAAVVVVGVAFLVTTPRFGWYAGVLVALVAMAGAIEWLPVAFAPSVIYLGHFGSQPWVPATTYAVAALLTGVALAYRHPDSLRQCLRYASSTTAHLPSSRSTAHR